MHGVGLDETLNRLLENTGLSFRRVNATTLEITRTAVAERPRPAAPKDPRRIRKPGEVIRPFNARMNGGLKPTIRNIHADGGTVIVFFDASGTARDGKPYQNTYAWFLEMLDGKVVKAFAFFDSIELDDYWRRVSPAGG